MRIPSPLKVDKQCRAYVIRNFVPSEADRLAFNVARVAYEVIAGKYDKAVQSKCSATKGTGKCTCDQNHPLRKQLQESAHVVNAISHRDYNRRSALFAEIYAVLNGARLAKIKYKDAERACGYKNRG